MYSAKNNGIARVFSQNQAFPLSNNKYTTRSTKIQFLKPFFGIKSTQLSISELGPHLWNTLIPQSVHNLSFNNFKLEVKKFVIYSSIFLKTPLNY